tara:strand:+ start:140 stop:1126 length:987 start_codon:yes stop_codon:yes gene_type:complete
MATYKVTKGTPVAFRDSAYPATYPSPHEGELFYNSSSGAFQFLGLGAGTWSSGAALNTAATATKGFGATIATSQVNGGAPNLVKTEAYNGTAWTELNNLSSGRYAHAAFGIATAGIVTGGQTDGGTAYHVNTESWDGTSWTEVNNLNEGRFKLAGMGLQGAGLATGGYDGSSYVASNESWNGTSWTEVGDLNDGRTALQGSGIATAALVAGGESPGIVAKTETWDGSSWTEVNDLNQARYTAGMSTNAVNTDTLLFGGFVPPSTANTEAFDGTSWTELANMANARYTATGSGIGSGALASGSDNNGNAATTSEEWTVASFQVKTLTTS